MKLVYDVDGEISYASDDSNCILKLENEQWRTYIAFT